MSFNCLASTQLRVGGLSGLILAASVGGCLLQGCTSKQDLKFKPSDVTSFAAPQLEPPLSDSDKTQGQQQVEKYVADINSKDYGAAEKLFTPDWQSKCPRSTLVHEVTSKGFWTMLPHSHDWAFDQFQSLRRGSEMVVHVHFIATDTNLYRTNFIFRKIGSEWLINEILYPVQKNKSAPVLGQMGARPTRRSLGK